MYGSEEPEFKRQKLEPGLANAPLSHANWIGQQPSSWENGQAELNSNAQQSQSQEMQYARQETSGQGASHVFI